MDNFTKVFWISTLLYFGLSIYLLCCTKKTPVFYAQIASGCGMFLSSKIGRKFLGFEVVDEDGANVAVDAENGADVA